MVGLDAAPGGTSNLIGMLTTMIGPQVEAQFGGSFAPVNLNRPISFIPTGSALDITQGDYFTNYLLASGGIEHLADLTPFDAVYFGENQYHNAQHLDIDGKIAEAITSEIEHASTSWLVPIIGSDFMQ